VKKTKEKPASQPGQVQVVVRHSPTFGDWYDIGTDAGAVILATNNGSGLKPRTLCLRHQVYVEKVRKLEQEHGPVTVIPVRRDEYVELPNRNTNTDKETQ